MKIKKKNTTIPINGKIVDTENVEDKTSNAPSLRLVEEMTKDIYSTEEVRIGTWLNKPLYRKVINAGVINISAGSSINIAHNISNIELVNKVEAKIVYLSAKTQNTYYLPYINGANNTSVTIVDKTNVVIKSIGEGWSGHNIYITLEYTKTTD